MARRLRFQSTCGRLRLLMDKERKDELGQNRRQLEAAKRQGQGAMGQAHRRSHRPDRRQQGSARWQDPGAIRDIEGRSRAPSPRVRNPAIGRRSGSLTEERIMSKLTISLLMCAGLAFGGAVGAAPISKDAYKAEKDRIESTYKADKDACAPLKDNAKDVCVERAKAKEKIAKAENEAAYKDTEKARYNARIAHAEADYAVAKEKCDDFSGNQKDVCVKEAKAAQVKAKADAKVAHVSNDTARTAAVKQQDARRDAAEDKRDANYKVAVEKCDSLSGAAKDQCVKDAKMRYGKT